MPKIILPRTGTAEAPLVIEGESIASADAKYEGRDDRWYHLVVYRKPSRELVAHVRYTTVREYESSMDYVLQGKDAAALSILLRDFALGAVVSDNVTGFPAGEPYETKRMGVVRKLQAALKIAVSEVASKIGESSAGE